MEVVKRMIISCISETGDARVLTIVVTMSGVTGDISDIGLTTVERPPNSFLSARTVRHYTVNTSVITTIEIITIRCLSLTNTSEERGNTKDRRKEKRFEVHDLRSLSE